MNTATKQLPDSDKLEHEREIMKEIDRMTLYQTLILVDAKKYRTYDVSGSDQEYYIEEAELYRCIPGVGIQVLLMPTRDEIFLGLIPFEWIEVITVRDNEHNKPLIVCRFEGIIWPADFNSPFKELEYVYENKNYKEGMDPDYLMYTTVQN